jgi:hypothetical protein
MEGLDHPLRLLDMSERKAANQKTKKDFERKFGNSLELYKPSSRMNG